MIKDWLVVIGFGISISILIVSIYLLYLAIKL